MSNFNQQTATPRIPLNPITDAHLKGPSRVPNTQPMSRRSSTRLRRNLLLDLPISGRLTLGFLIAGLIATLAASIIGVQRAQSLSLQSNFYQTLLSTNTSLTTGANFLELMNTETHTILDVATSPTPSQETLSLDQKAVTNLTAQYNSILNDYIAHDLLSKHSDQSALLAEANHSIQVTQQQTLAGSALRAWNVYKAAQTLILQDVSANHLTDAQALERTQAELTNADALSAIRSLIQFDGRLAASVHDAATVEEQNQIITTIIGAILAFICIILVGLFISNTIVQRLRALRQVTQAVEQGQINARVNIVGRDEIADVSESVNTMLETIVGLLDETRSQRDALTNAAEHLFSEMRVVSAGDLRVNAPVSNDPIGMLADAFNFTIGRFRRFLLRTQTTVEQIEVLSRQELERSEQFLKLMNNQLQAQRFTTTSPTTSAIAHRSNSGTLSERLGESEETALLLTQVRLTREHLHQLNSIEPQHVQTLYTLSEQLPASIERLAKLMSIEVETRGQAIMTGITQGYIQELRALDALAKRTASELQQTQQQSGHIQRVTNDLEDDLLQLTTLARRLMLKSEIAAPKENGQDSTRLSLAFVQEMTILARNLANVAQEMRSSIISFQLDSAERLRE